MRIVGMVRSWKEKQPDPEGAVYIFRDEDYLLNMSTELDFLSDNPRVMENLTFEGKERLASSNLNPFVCPVPLAKVMDNKVTWATEEDFHFTKTRILGEDTDILEVKELSIFLMGEIRDATEDKWQEIREEEAAVPVDPHHVPPPMNQQDSPDSSKQSVKKLPFFTTAEFKYATYLPRRNVMGDLEGLTEVELAQSMMRVGTGETFDAKSQKWRSSSAIDMASTRRGTFFGTLSREKADQPVMKLRRITETVAMLGARERLTKVKLE